MGGSGAERWTPCFSWLLFSQIRKSSPCNTPEPRSWHTNETLSARRHMQNSQNQFWLAVDPADLLASRDLPRSRGVWQRSGGSPGVRPPSPASPLTPQVSFIEPAVIYRSPAFLPAPAIRTAAVTGWSWRSEHFTYVHAYAAEHSALLMGGNYCIREVWLSRGEETPESFVSFEQGESFMETLGARLGPGDLIVHTEHSDPWSETHAYYFAFFLSLQRRLCE